MRLGWKSWGGIIPKISPRSLPDVNAQTARNCWIAEKDLQAIKEPLAVQAVPNGSESIYLWRHAGSQEWLSWLTDVNVVRGPIADDQYSRIYFTDGTTLHMKLWDASLGTPKVEVDDVSIVAPAAPTITKGQLFDPSGITATDQGVSCPLTGYSWTDGTLTLTFNVPSHQVIAQNVNLPFRITTAFGNTPTGATDPQSHIYSDLITIPNVGKFQVVNIQNQNSGTTPTPQSGWTIPYDKVVTVNMNFVRSTTQYQYYVQTIVNGYGQESPPSVPSDEVTWMPNDTIQVHTTGSGTTVRIYRSATGTSESNFFFVAEVSPGTVYTDNNTDAQLAETMPLLENPPTAMMGLVSMPGGFLAAFNGKDIFFSEPWLPYSWPTRYRITVDFDVVGLAVSGADLIVLTTGNPYYVSGTHPDIMTQSKLPIEQSCVAKRSICFAERFVCYASPDGLCSITGGQVQVITSSYYTRDQWQALQPSLMIAAVHDARFIGFIPGGGIIIDFREVGAPSIPYGYPTPPSVGTTDQVAYGLYSDLINDQLYLIQDDDSGGLQITDWRAGANYLTYTWHSKIFQNVQDAIWSACKIIADSYANTTLKIYENGVQVWSYPVPSNMGFRVPKFDRSAEWEIELIGTDRIVEVVLASSMMLLRTGDQIQK